MANEGWVYTNMSARVCVCVCVCVRVGGEGCVNRGTSQADSPSMLFLSREHQIPADGGTLGHRLRSANSRSSLQRQRK